MNAKQAEVIEYVKHRWLTVYGGKNGEFKSVSVEPLGDTGIVVLQAQIGAKNDEDTMLMICRTRHQVFIGVRGGISAYNKNTVKVKGRKAIYERI